MFDPFGDFETAGYLRNRSQEKDPANVRRYEYNLFRAQLTTALVFLSRCERIEYEDFLEVHRILFEGLYPWAGQDRYALLPDRAITKGPVIFCHPRDCRRAVDDALSRAQEKRQMRTIPGFVMGMFAYAHPFFDGNGRTMLLVHAELCFRAGISIDWIGTDKNAYLTALTNEIEDPRAGHLDNYLSPYIGKAISRESWSSTFQQMRGLDGNDEVIDETATYADPSVLKGQEAFELKRGYVIGDDSFVPTRPA
ncbi:Fic/DOC family protein [Pseudomonas sp. CGJS7]|uniref:Fic/DOC family protein n=1 Tax=Pseudomonas sp. CGJS7 TaxID=3109348 RepID=UPI00300B0238